MRKWYVLILFYSPWQKHGFLNFFFFSTRVIRKWKKTKVPVHRYKNMSNKILTTTDLLLHSPCVSSFWGFSPCPWFVTNIFKILEVLSSSLYPHLCNFKSYICAKLYIYIIYFSNIGEDAKPDVLDLVRMLPQGHSWFFLCVSQWLIRRIWPSGAVRRIICPSGFWKFAICLSFIG